MDHSKDELVLVVDDNPANLGVLCNLLAGAGFAVAIATDGATAIEQACSELPDLILLDINLPDINGFEVCRRLKADPSTRGATIIFMTALTDTESKLKGLREGAVDYITKPFEGQEVLARIDVHMQLRTLTRKLAQTNERLAEANERLAETNERLAESNERLAETNEHLSKENQQRALVETTLQALTHELERRVEERTNALSYALDELAQVRIQLLAANEVLEHEANDRAKELHEAKEQLQEELAERVRAEQARAVLQEEIISMQRAALAELSTPLIPITERIMVMPMIGSIGEDRAQQILEAALDGVHQHNARVVILDVTGLKAVNTGIASTLVRMANALRMLGAKAVITGVRPDLAQTFIAENIDLAGVTTCGTLRAGIVHALALSGDRMDLFHEAPQQAHRRKR